MPFKDKKSDNLEILSGIYQNDRTESNKNKNLLIAIRSYFSDPQKAERWLSGAVLFLGFFGLIFGIFYFKSQISSPFARQPFSQIGSLNVNSAEDLLGLMGKDTDGDGLSDYDELYVYKTSQYLKDSDSDGVPDAKEIASGTDPNCPAGQDCFAFKDVTPIKNINSSSVGNVLEGGYTAAQLRTLLKEAGMSADMLNQLSDEEIIQSYQEALSAVSSNTNAGTTVNLGGKTISDLSPQAIRDLLKSQGVSADALSQISDDELMDLVSESLQEVN